MRILIAEKEEALRSIVSTRLHARHYEVMEAGSSEETLRVLESGNFDLILLSSEMERVGGHRLIEKIRQKSHFATVPVILLIEENKIAELVTSHDYGFDDFLIKPFDPLVLQLRVAMNITRVRHRVEANALTHLPGNGSIERAVRETLQSGEKFSVLYIDINNFKSFNDRYGFEKGDGVIRQTAQILVQTAEAMTGEGGQCFVGHIGGDDFVVLLPVENEEPFARRFIAEFDRIMPTYYNERDQKKGFVKLTNRRGKQDTFPLMSCSVAACNNLDRQYKSLGEIAQDAAEVKSFLKSQPGSHYLRDRRSAQVRGAAEALEILTPEAAGEKEAENMDPIGQVLINAGLITHEQLGEALKKHLQTGKRLGQVLISMNAVRSEDVGRMLEKRLNVPYVSLKRFKMGREVQRIFTEEFIRAHRVLPLEIAGDKLRLGMCDPFDLRTIDAIERITGLKPVPCLALEDEFEEFLERFSKAVPFEEKAG